MYYGNASVQRQGTSIAREVRRNERIRAREVLVIGDDGEHRGVLSLRDALEEARDRGLDLVEVAPGAVPPVCRMLDYGKYMYDQAKKERSSAKQHHRGELREVRFKVKIGQHDLDMKVRRAEGFLRERNKVKLSVMFRGRENAHPEIGRTLLQGVRKQLEEISVVEKPPTMEGRFMNMILGPISARELEQLEAKPKEVKPENEAQVSTTS